MEALLFSWILFLISFKFWKYLKISQMLLNRFCGTAGSQQETFWDSLSSSPTNRWDWLDQSLLLDKLSFWIFTISFQFSPHTMPKCVVDFYFHPKVLVSLFRTTKLRNFLHCYFRWKTLADPWIASQGFARFRHTARERGVPVPQSPNPPNTTLPPLRIECRDSLLLWTYIGRPDIHRSIRFWNFVMVLELPVVE